MSDINTNEPQQYFCTECGLLVGADDLFCPHCGADLSIVEDYNPDEPVVLKIFLSADAAKTAINNLAANEINAAEGLKSWSQSSDETIVYVRREDLPRAQEVLRLMANKPQPMQLGDIFSSSFTTTVKTMKKNIVIAAMLIPVVILMAYSVSSFFGAMAPLSTKKGKIPVNVETPVKRVITYSYTATGVIDSNLNAVMDIDEVRANTLRPLDKLWVNLDSAGHREIRGYVSKIFRKKTDEDNTLTHTLIIKFSDSDKYLQAGAWCEAEIDSKTPDAVLSVSQDCIYYTDFDESEEETTADTTISEDTTTYQDTTFSSGEFVYMVSDGRAKSIEVTSGVYNDDYIEIVSGLSGNEKVINAYYSDDDLEDSAKVVIDKEVSDPKEAAQFKSDEYIWLFMLFAFAGLLLALVYLAANIGITKASLKELAGEKTTLRELFRTIFSYVYTRCIALFLLIFLIGGGIITILIALISLGKSLNNDFLGILGALLFFPAAIFGLYFYIRWYFSVICIIDTNATVTEALKRSSFLVKGYWWRTFGIVILVSIVINFMISMITTPISFIFMWDYISQSFSSSPDIQKAMGPEQMKSFGWGIGLSIMLNYILELLILPVFHVVMYNDLKFRKNDYLVKLKPEKINPEFPFGQS